MRQQFVVETETHTPLNDTHVSSALKRYVEERLGDSLVSVDVHEIRDKDPEARP